MNIEGGVKNIALSEASRDVVIGELNDWIRPLNKTPVLIISYETLRMHVEIFKGFTIDLMICDEAHRFKNANTLTNKALNSLNCYRYCIHILLIFKSLLLLLLLLFLLLDGCCFLEPQCKMIWMNFSQW